MIDEKTQKDLVEISGFNIAGRYEEYKTNLFCIKNMSDAISIARDYVSYLNKVGVPVSSAYLYGSYVTGKSRPASDIDICVVSSSFAGKDFFDEMVKLNKLGLKIDSRIEAVPFTPDDLNDKYSSLANEIRSTGVSL